MWHFFWSSPYVLTCTDMYPYIFYWPMSWHTERHLYKLIELTYVLTCILTYVKNICNYCCIGWHMWHLQQLSETIMYWILTNLLASTAYWIEYPLTYWVRCKYCRAVQRTFQVGKNVKTAWISTRICEGQTHLKTKSLLVQTCSNPFHVGRIDRLVGLFMSAALDRLRKSVNSKCVLMFVGSIHLSNLSLACNQLRKMAPNYIQLIKCWVKSVPLVVPSCVLNQHFFGPSPPSPCGITMPEQLCSCRENQDEPSDFEVQGDF